MCLLSKVIGTHQIPWNVVVSYYVGAGKEPRSSVKPASVLNH